MKISKSGRLYLDYYSVTLDDLGPNLDEIKALDEAVGYFRESPQSKHNHDLADTVMRMIMDRGIKLGLGQQPFEWGPVTSFLLYQGPEKVFLHASAKERMLRFSFIPRGKTERVSTQAELSATGAFLQQAGVLVSADFIMETPMREPNKQLTDELLPLECLYVAVKCDGSPQWASFYEGDTAPSNVKSFVEDVVWLIFDQFPKVAELNR